PDAPRAGDRPGGPRAHRGFAQRAGRRRRPARPRGRRGAPRDGCGEAARAMSGRVYLVGAGPGDPGLLTRRAERCLAAADVVVHDYLVSASLRSLVRPEAEVVAVGRSHDARLA